MTQFLRYRGLFVTFSLSKGRGAKQSFRVKRICLCLCVCASVYLL